MAIRVGIIGSNYGRAHIMPLRWAGFEVVALSGRDAEKTARIAAEEGIPQALTDVAALCAQVDAVVVAGPDRLHHDHVLTALAHGCHVLCEKPLAPDVSSCEALIAAAQDAGRVCAVAFAYHHIGVVRQFAHWLRGRERPRWLSVAVPNSFAGAEGINRDDRGPLMGESGDFGGASHLVDAALWLMDDEPAWVQASLMGRPVHSIALHIGLAHGSVIQLTQFAASEPGIHGQWHLAGDGWEARFQAEYQPALASWRVGPFHAYTTRGDDASQWHEVAGAVQAGPEVWEPWFEGNLGTARAFARAIAGEPVGRDELLSFADAARVQRIFSAAMQSEMTGRRVLLSR